MERGALRPFLCRFLFHLTPSSPEGFLCSYPKANLMKGFENYFGNAGDMTSGSQHPGEHNDWLDLHQKELERQRKRPEKQQQL